MSKVCTVAVLGAGNRGREAYGKFILEHPGEIKVVAIAEPNDARRELFAAEHQVPKENQFKSWEALLARDRLADGLIIATMDTMHLQPALQAMEKGYKILLEKPIAPNLKDTWQIVKKARQTGAEVLVAHVLRYTNFYRELKRILDEGLIGQVRLVNHIENIGYFHFAHSYVRGNWRNTKVAAPIILAKSCHDLDLLFWLLGQKARTLFSQASLEHFTAEQQPEGAGERCLDCSVELTCPYSARKIYLGDNTAWPTSVITTDLSYAGRYQALAEGPYGRCVYKCDNNVPEIQTVSMSMEDHTEVNFALNAFSKEITRITSIYGTKGELRADFARGQIKIHNFNGYQEEITVSDGPGGHGGGDAGLMQQFIRVLREEKFLDDGLTTLEASLESHLMAFGAEISRAENRVINLNQLREDK